MLTDEELSMQVAALAQRGWGSRRIADALGTGRKRVRSLLKHIHTQREQGHSALPAAPVRRDSKLDALVPKMLALLKTFPDITAVRMHEELAREGYKGGHTIVKDRLRELRPRPKAPFVERFETGPGEQGQQDWSPYEITFTVSGLERVHCFSFVLGFSRRQFISFQDGEDMTTFQRQHIACFQRFKGVPHETLYDNQKVVALGWEAGRPVYNPKFLAFATHYGFVPRVLRPRKPEHKGKVERPFQYVETHCLGARTFRDRAELDAHALWWMDEISDKHLHGTTRERPIDRFAQEQEHLLPLPRHDYDTAEVAYRVVSQEALVRSEDVTYSVPHSAILDVVIVRVTEHEVIVYGNDIKEIARHERAPRGHSQPVINPAHRPARSGRHDVEALVARLGQLGEPAALFAAGIVDKQRYRGAQLAEVLALVEQYSADDLLRALDRAVRYRAFDAGVVSRILAATATPRALPSTEEVRTRARLNEQREALSVTPRSLTEYARVLDGEEMEE